jgi:hypothetical protein
MSIQFHYESDLNGGTLMVRESRIVADLLLSNLTKAEWNIAIRYSNLILCLIRTKFTAGGVYGIGSSIFIHRTSEKTGTLSVERISRRLYQ